MNAIYEGSVRHRRFAERPREFAYGLSLAYLDVDDLPRALVRRSPGLVRWRRRDYLGDPSVPLGDALRDLVEERTGTRPSGPIRQLTQLRTLGRCFNPVSFYYCYDEAGRLAAAVADVTNTPRRKRHAYVIEGGRGGVIRGTSSKELYVSPFLAMDQRYSWSVAEPAATLSVHIENHRAGEKVFDATLSLRRCPMTKAALLRHPFGSWRVLALIYAQALRLKLRGVAVHPHPGAGT
jgi:DUF1365 family protein